jgi:hypothetical protein
MESKEKSKENCCVWSYTKRGSLMRAWPRCPYYIRKACDIGRI